MQSLDLDNCPTPIALDFLIEQRLVDFSSLSLFSLRYPPSTALILPCRWDGGYYQSVDNLASEGQRGGCGGPSTWGLWGSYGGAGAWGGFGGELSQNGFTIGEFDNGEQLHWFLG